ncbi:MAG TPA: carboxypeptidase regulatory-like domain-containing protein [Bryobacteraceae bacterium]|nr:carboxypeptidase regulatory-like domain-containing protein [Bryobacteraceae bacterium]
MRCLSLVAVLFSSSFFLSAQTNLASINGVVTDPSLKAVPRAEVRTRSAETGAVRLTTTGSAGQFEFPGLAPGQYTIEVQAAGFAVAKHSLRLEIGQNARLDLGLTLGEATSSVEVAARAESLKTEDTSLGEVVENKSVQELPLNGRMLLDLALTVPGSHASHGAQMGDMNPLYWRPGQNSSLTIGGNRPNANYFLIDGAANTDPTFNTQNLSLSPDAVREFQVQTGTYSAEMGGAGGGQINIVTKGGTSQYHGTVYEFLRNGAMDAGSYNEDPGGKFLVQNNFGAALGGPLPFAGKKTFFFTNYEGLRKVKAVTSIATVPTEEEVGGDFSGAGVDIFNPFSSRPNPNYDPARPISRSNPTVFREPFPGNVIPRNLLSPAASTMLQKYVPRPNTMNMGAMIMNGVPSVVGAGNDSNNFLDQRNARNFTDQGTFRVDRVFDRGDTISARFSVGKEDGFMPQNLPGFGLNHDNLSQHANLAWTRILSPNLVNTASIAYSRLAMTHFEENSFTRDIVGELGIQGVGFGGSRAWGAPLFNVQGYSAFGDTFQATPMQSWDTVLEGRNALSWQHGSHSLKFGGSYRWFIWPMWAYVQSRGYYQFTSGYTTQTANNDGTGSALASFELELPAVRQRQVGSPRMNLRQWYADAFIQDTWRISPTTTINAGLRYEFMSPLVDISNQWAGLFVSPTALTAYIGGQQGTPKGLLYPNKLNFAPRLGIARQIPGAGLVLRAGFGLFYTPVDMNTWCNNLHNVPIIFPETNQSDSFTPSITTLNFNPPVVGRTVTSFTAFDPYQAPQYISQWTLSVQKSLGRETTFEAGYQGDRGFHLQRSHLINNAPPGPGLVQPRRPYGVATFQPGTEFPAGTNVVSNTIPVSTVNWLENTARSWYDAAYINLRRRYSSGLSILANYTFAKNLTDAPDFRSTMFEAAIAQNNNDLNSEKGPACDIRHRFVLSAVYDVQPLRSSGWARALTRNWRLSTIYQAQSGFPFTISVFGDSANSGTALGEHPIRANYTGQPVFDERSRTPEQWFNPLAFSAPAPYTFGNVGRNTVYGPGMVTLDFAIARTFRISETSGLQFRIEAFNGLNKVNLGTPNRFVNTAQFGTITEPASPGRQIQLSARFSF